MAPSLSLVEMDRTMRLTTQTLGRHRREISYSALFPDWASRANAGLTNSGVSKLLARTQGRLIDWD